ncbi:MAG: aminotransferase class III-fold pyridoxal phosphate-dependent enzyme [Verrucomicrobia bacterium]|nr:aminotransferase class III-fold pyridoxal phosphate-dependent enzyme [Verrucomicrobiota bacterium]
MLLILDELKTCPRVAMGGVQEVFGVKADLTIVGKGLANGFAFAAVLGPKWLDSARHESRIMGTFNAELSGFAAMLATIEILRREDAPRELATLGSRFVDRTNHLLREQSLYDFVQLSAEPWPSMPRIRIGPRPDLERRLASETARRGACVLCPHMSFVCLRHTTEELELAAAGVVAAASELRKE